MNTIRAGSVFTILAVWASSAALVDIGRGQDDPAGLPSALQQATRIVDGSGRSGGICVLVGMRDADLAIAMGKQGGFVVQSLYADDAMCDRMRAIMQERGRYGVVSAGVFEGGRLPYADNLVNILVVNDVSSLQQRGLSLAEVARVLAPLGTVFLGVASDDSQTEKVMRQAARAGLETVEPTTLAKWTPLRKPWPEEIDQWTHYLHGADGNPVARDRVVGPPKHYQWIAGPMWQRSHETDSSISTLVTANGRLFYIVDEAPISLTGQHPLPDKWFLAARDAFNGVDLWKVPIRRWGWREWKETWFDNRPGDFPLNLQKRLVAVGDRVYVTLGYHAPVTQLDARTGEFLQTYDGTERTNEILVLDDTLILSVLGDDGVRVRAVDASDGETRWVTQQTYRGTTVDYLKWSGSGGGVKPAKLDPSLNLASDGRSIALLDGPDVVCLDFASGKERWRAPFPSAETDLSAGGIRSDGDLWNGTMIVRDGVVIHASPGKLAAMAAADGSVLWEQPKRYIGHL
ncbi:MAG: PQQ-like beta-propeller repeat protein, partial [Planctomycetes bacterium]|nr:PQQ-like beta-propeller repeat protein [Planctomycetota bacterium]